jgi:PAS domain S-box-containing protein
VLAVGAALCDLSGRPLPEVLGAPVRALLQPWSHAELQHVLRAAREGAASGSATLRLRHADGSGVEVRTSWSLLAGAGADSTQLTFVRAESVAGGAAHRRLRVHEAFGRLSSEVVVVADAQGAVLYASLAVEALFGYDAEQVVTSDLWGFLHPDDVPPAMAAYRALVDGAGPRTAALRVRAAAGDWRWVECVAMNLLDQADGRVICAVHDITAEVEAKQALRASEARFRAITDVRRAVQELGADRPLGEDAERRHALAAELRTALAQDALDVDFQPVVDVRAGTVVGIEALARWTHPQRGLVPPSSFVAVAELTGLAPELDRWVLQRALRDVAALREAGVVPDDAYLAVNLSACTVGDTSVLDDLLAWTEESGLPAGQLVLEITETAVMHDADAAVHLLRRLREQGFGVAMDDFGTGYSSLARLRDLPLSALKIDRSFVADITARPDVRAIVASVVALARALGIAVVAEGVETAEQCSLLQELGCDTAQGWLWSPAVPATALLCGPGWGAPLTGD